jgi:PadR family transcriptional regulator, regulatory protein PadR
MPAKSELPQGTLDLLILRVVAIGPVHGYAIAQRLEQVSRGVVRVPQGSLYPALHRLENRGLLAADWKQTDTGREAKFYRLTQKGGAQLQTEAASWQRLIEAVGLISAWPMAVRNDLVAAPVAANQAGRTTRKGAALPP